MTTVPAQVFRIRLDERRRPTLPPALLEQAGIATDAHDLVARVDGPGRVVLEDPAALLAALQNKVRAGKLANGIDGDLAELLLAERATEARQDRDG